MGKYLKFGRYGICFWTDKVVKPWAGGRTIGPFVFIRPKYRSPFDKGLFEHEMCHTRQWWNPVNWFREQIDWELEAYAVQVKCYPRPEWERKMDIFATFLSTNYGFGITWDLARELLSEEVYG